MQSLIDTAVEAATAHPVDDLLRVYLGQSSGSRAPEPARHNPALDALDLWDYLGDFA